jgi:hypothetical protein
MDHATDPVAPADAERVEVGDSCRTWPKRRGLSQGEVRPVGVVVRFVLAKDLRRSTVP